MKAVKKKLWTGWIRIQKILTEKRRDINGRIDPCTGRHYRSGYHF